MQTERWRRVESLFQSALERGPEAREAFLRKACAGDAALRNEIELLLAAYEQNHDFLEVPAFDDGLRLLENLWALKPGDRVGRYEILSRIGAGGMGEVYLAHDRGLARKVAIKVLPAAFAADKERVRRLYREGRAASALNHPSILTVYEIGETHGRPFLATEFVEGATLREHLRKACLPPEEAVRIVRQVASALEASHNAGVLHRDIKPENIMLRPDGYVKVLDFGLAKVLPAASRNESRSTVLTADTEPGRIAGSIHYMSPEQVSGHELDGRTDLWSLGVVFYEMLAGSPPFSGATLNHVAVAILESDFPDLPASVPERLGAVIQKALTKDPDRRYRSARELMSDLEGGTASPSYPIPASTGRLPRFSRVISWVSIVALALIAAFGIRSWLMRPDSPPLYERMVPLTNGGNVTSAAASPDGRYLAFATNSGDQQGMWLRQISTRTNLVRVPPQNVAYRGIQFSPDGNHIYYVVQQPSGEGTLSRAPVIGGETRTLIKDVDGAVALSPNGEQIGFVRGDPARGITMLMLASSDGGGQRQLAARKSTEAFVEGSLAWSPDGSAIAAGVLRPSSKGQKIALIGTRLRSGEEWDLSTHTWSRIDALHWRGNDLLLVGTSDDSMIASQIFRLDLEGGAITNVTKDANSYSNLSVTNDGGIVAVQQQRIAAVWTSGSAEPAQVSKATPGDSQYFGVSWTGDSHLITLANVGGKPEVWRIGVDGQSAEVLTQGEYEQRYPRTCAGAGYVLFTSSREDGWKIWRMDADGRNPLRLTRGSSTDAGAVCTPDGKWVIFNSDRSGNTTLWRVSIDGGEPEQLTTNVSYYPEVSPDGKFIACTFLDAASASEGAIAILPITGGKPVRRLKDIPAYSPLRWGPRRDSLTFVRAAGDVSNLFVRDVFDGSERQLTRFDSQQIFAFDWSRDLSKLALIRGIDARNAVMLTSLRPTETSKR